MTDTSQPQTGSDCTPTTNPASQPNAPGKDCPVATNPQPPCLADPTPCTEYSGCSCKTSTTPTSNCLESMIAEQTAQITAADKAKTFKADLEALLGKAKAAA